MSTLDRRRFLALGAAAAGTLAVGGCGLTGRRDVWTTMFGDLLPGVRTVGEQGIASGTVPTLEDAIARLPSGQIVLRVDSVGEVSSIDVTNPSTLLRATERLVADELARDDFVSLSGYPLTPTEVALAALVWFATT